jgi:hypothetical protein
MSTIKVDTLQTRAGTTAAVTGAGFVATDQIRGNTAANSVTVVAEGGTVTTNLQQGLAKVWLRADVDGSTLLDSFNMTSVTDNGTGDYTPTFANDFNNALYSLTSTAQHGGSNNDDSRIMTQQDRNVTAGASRIRRTTANGSGTVGDGDYNVSIHGDLA